MDVTATDTHNSDSSGDRGRNDDGDRNRDGDRDSDRDNDYSDGDRVVTARQRKRLQ